MIVNNTLTFFSFVLVCLYLVKESVFPLTSTKPIIVPSQLSSFHDFISQLLGIIVGVGAVGVAGIGSVGLQTYRTIVLIYPTTAATNTTAILPTSN